MSWRGVIALAVVVAGLLGAFAIYTWGWRSDAGNDRRRVDAYGAEVARLTCGEVECIVIDSRTVGPKIWQVEITAPEGPNRCFNIDLDRFRHRIRPRARPAGVADELEGVGSVACTSR